MEEWTEEGVGVRFAEKVGIDLHGHTRMRVVCDDGRIQPGFVK